MFEESKHPRDSDGKFTEGSRNDRNDKIDEAERIYNSDLPSSPPKIILSKREYAVLRQEVMRKNAEQKGKLRPTNYAFTANNFYIYKTSGGDDFVPLARLDIENDRKKIDKYMELFGGG